MILMKALEAVVLYLKVLFQHSLEELRETTKNMTGHTVIRSRLEPGPPECEERSANHQTAMISKRSPCSHDV
jgi:hypothetical protein